jgi:serine/threonine-protein kinase
MPKVCLMCGESFPDSTTFCPRDGSALRAAVKGDDLIGELIGERYLITDLISHGGMGSVYLASDVRLPQQFAVKVLKDQMSPDPAVISRFRQEAEAVCRINHDRVARVFDFGFMEDGRAYIIMEYAAGVTLADVIDERAPLSVTDAAKITLMIAEGLEAAHRLGIIHRDLKPENVMVLDDPGGSMRIKVLDFGIAKLIDADAGKGYTQPGFVIGTPIWMSPEQLRGDTLDARSDVYSLALLSYAMLTKQRPFVGETEQVEMLARLAATPRTLAEVAPQISWAPALQAIFDRTLSREIDDRPSSALSFAEAMTKVSAQMGSVAATSTYGTAASAPVKASTITPLSTPALSNPTSGQTPNALSGSPSQSAVATKPVTSVRWKLYGLIAAPVAAAALVTVLVLKPFNGEPPSVQDVANTPNSVPASSPVASSAPAATAPDTTAVGSPPGSSSTTAIRAVDSSVQRAPVVSPPTAPQAARTPPAETRGSSSNTTPPPAKSGATKMNAELQRIVDAFDATNGSPASARTTIPKINALLPQLTTSLDQGWAQLYLGMSHATLEDKASACAAFKLAGALGAESNTVRSTSVDWRTLLGCGP